MRDRFVPCSGCTEITCRSWPIEGWRTDTGLVPCPTPEVKPAHRHLPPAPRPLANHSLPHPTAHLAFLPPTSQCQVLIPASLSLRSPPNPPPCPCLTHRWLSPLPCPRSLSPLILTCRSFLSVPSSDLLTFLSIGHRIEEHRSKEVTQIPQKQGARQSRCRA